jgi:hypothetical protein
MQRGETIKNVAEMDGCVCVRERERERREREREIDR